MVTFQIREMVLVEEYYEKNDFELAGRAEV